MFNTGEGDRYFIYRSFDSALSDSGVKNVLKKERNWISGTLVSGYQYLPTGEQAFCHSRSSKCRGRRPMNT